MSRRRKHRHFQYTLNLKPELISQLNNNNELSLLEEIWRQTFCAQKNVGSKDPFWTSIINYAFI